MGTSLITSFLNYFRIIFRRKICRQDSRNNQAGFSLIEVAAATAVSTLVVLGTSSLFINSAKMESGQERQFWIAARRMELQGIIRSQAGWNSILASNSALACLTPPNSCSAFSTPQPLKIPEDAVILDGSNPQLGLTNKGEFCYSFDAANGNSACPVGVQLSWTALCDDASCLHAQPKIMVQFQVKEPRSSIQNLKSYDLVVFKDPKLETLNQVCVAMGGILVGSTCTITALSTACDPANALGLGPTYPLGFDSNGKVICGKPNPGTCSASDVATGFDVNGGLICAPACL